MEGRRGGAGGENHRADRHWVNWGVGGGVRHGAGRYLVPADQRGRAAGGGSMTQPVSYLQTDPRWGSLE